MPEQDRITYLLVQYANDRCTRAELQELMQLANSEQLDTAMEVVWEQSSTEADIIDREALYRRIAPPRKRYTWWAAAAAVLLIATVAGSLLLRTSTSIPPVVATIQPGYHQATLTLGDGRTVTLDSNGVQQLSEGNTAIQQQGGLLQYTAKAGAGENVYNTLATPRGGQFSITLPDGSRVWLNAASSLTYPIAFGNTRKVTVTGEAYFEIAADAQRPFTVAVAGKQDIQVLGTSFNVNAYTDEPAITTTLLQGAVRVTGAGQNVQLQPGEQVLQQQQLTVKQVNTAQAIAWKNGLFNFEDADVKGVLRQLERWYDITVEYRGTMPEREFSGKLQRSLTLQQVLEGLSEMGVHFAIEGRKLIVTP
ncbi:FecR domain-containing protein [Chitinophaga horti]|uniref:FecR domain-containing protein n=1 Tax=Chitinophaga horti TaxID=2920382 RepID=A0ABY6J942_9BACT|nr:FecR family protein [Chitinophaga horti]UYQ94814.1 FecR domain-containing protein [Chitinophaga horti]